MKTLAGLLLIIIYSASASGQQTQIRYLSGTDKDHPALWDFYCSSGRQSGSWKKIAVPSNWEMQGFGTFNYYTDKLNPEERGYYRTRFSMTPAEKKVRVFLVFEGSMTDTEVKVNGRSAGAVHQGGFYEFRYDITALVNTDSSNLLEVNVAKRSANASVNQAERKADFWLFGGIFRPVYLEIVPEQHIDRIAIDARADGTARFHIFGTAGKDLHYSVQVSDLHQQNIGAPITGLPGDTVLSGRYDQVQTWNPEQPRLYLARISLMDGNRLLHTISERFGFRTVELKKGDGIYLNEKKIIFKGVCRHSEWPASGRTLSRDVHLLDIGLMKRMNMNAVRMSHYPPDKLFLDLCDSLGLFVLDELTGWQAAYDTVTGRKLVRELVIRDVNHPSVVIWDNGNEGGWNRALDAEFARYDPEGRPVIHPWERFNGTNTKHYPDYKYLLTELAAPKEIFFPTEFMHGLFDGGQGAGLDDFWTRMRQSPLAAGGFLWSFHDEGIVRGDRHDSIDVAGNAAPDGIVGPYRQKEASFYTIKEIWSPVKMKALNKAADFDGRFVLQNDYLFNDLAGYRLEWQELRMPGANDSTAAVVIRNGAAVCPQLAPGDSTVISFPVSRADDADVFSFSALDLNGDTVCSWTLRLRDRREWESRVPASKKIPAVRESATTIDITCDNILYRFDKKTGFLASVIHGEKSVVLSNGPAPAQGNPILATMQWKRKGDSLFVIPAYRGDSLTVSWRFVSGRLPSLIYSCKQRDSADFYGITFDIPAGSITGMRWYGRGPYRVWKNRLKGQQIGVWEKQYNNTVTGETWEYPEFKGWHAEVSWVKIETTASSFIVYTGEPGIYLGMLKPDKPLAAANANTSPRFPAGNLGFMQAISAIGTKFQPAASMGPASGPNTKNETGRFSGSLYFDFR